MGKKKQVRDASYVREYRRRGLGRRESSRVVVIDLERPSLEGEHGWA